MRGISEGDREQVQALVAQHEAALVRYALRITGDVESARDVVQDTFLKLWQVDRSGLEGGAAAWLYTVCRNRALDVVRKERRMNVFDPGGGMPRPPDPASDATGEPSTARVEALQVIATLPANQQEVVRLRFQGGLSYREIGAVTGNTESNVGYLIHTAIKALRAQMDVPSVARAPERSAS